MKMKTKRLKKKRHAIMNKKRKHMHRILEDLGFYYKDRRYHDTRGQYFGSSTLVKEDTSAHIAYKDLKLWIIFENRNKPGQYIDLEVSTSLTKEHVQKKLIREFL